MRRSFTHYLRLAAILTGISPLGGMAMAKTVQMQPGLKITLHVYNWAQVDSETVVRAKQETTRIYLPVPVSPVIRNSSESDWPWCPLGTL